MAHCGQGELTLMAKTCPRIDKGRLWNIRCMTKANTNENTNANANANANTNTTANTNANSNSNVDMHGAR